jgi:hypothetical protein
MLKIIILMYDAILHNDTDVNSKVPLAYLPLKEEDCARARFNLQSSRIAPEVIVNLACKPLV